MVDSSVFHKNAKDAGNRLSALVTNISFGAVAVYFLALTQKVIVFSACEKITLIFSLLFFVITSFLRLLELHLDAKRFYQAAINLDSNTPNWATKDKLQARRTQVIFAGYYTFALAVVSSIAFMLARIV